MPDPVADCGHSTAQDGEWPGETGTICFECWERECSESWWAFGKAWEDAARAAAGEERNV